MSLKWKYRYRYAGEIVKAPAIWIMSLARLITHPFRVVTYRFSVKDYYLNKNEIWREIDEIQHPQLYKNGKKVKELETTPR